MSFLATLHLRRLHGQLPLDVAGEPRTNRGDRNNKLVNRRYEQIHAEQFLLQRGRGGSINPKTWTPQAVPVVPAA